MRSLLRVRYREFALLGALTVAVAALGWIVARDVRRFEEDSRRLYERLAEAFELVDDLQFHTQEARRIHLYALHTSDANRQLDYADQAHAANAEVLRLLHDRDRYLASGTVAQLTELDRAWRQYLEVRDEVIGMILEGAVAEGVALDEQSGTARFNEVRAAVASLKHGFESFAAVQVSDAGTRSRRAMRRLALMVASAMLAAAFGIYLVHRRATLEALLRSEAHKGSILQAVPDPILSTDDTGRIVELNAAAERTFGICRSHALGAMLDELVLAAPARGVVAALMGVGDGVVPRIETVGVRRDGSTFPMEVAAVNHRVAGDRVWTVHVADLTERRHAEEQLRRAKEAAEDATQAKSDFLATMSHELRTPLSGVIGIAELLQPGVSLASQRELMRMLRSAATALHGLVRDILDYSRIEAGLTELIPVAFAVRQCVEDAFDPVAELAARKGLDLGCLIDADVPAFVVADEDRVRQVLLNLLSNAVKFTDSGEVAVHVSATRAEGDEVEIGVEVRDTGSGIPAHLHDRLFRRFTQIDATPAHRRQGAGLGLPIAQSLSRLLGGSLTVESSAGAGSTFTLRIHASIAAGRPAADPLRGSLAGTSALALVGPGIVGRQIRLMLREWAVDVVEPPADLGETAPALRVDVLIVEMGCRRAELARWRGIWPAVPVVAVTSLHTHGGDDLEPADRRIAVPVRAATLHDAIGGATRAEERLGPAEEPDRVFSPGALSVLLVDDNDTTRRVVRLMLEELGVEVDDAGSGSDAIVQAGRRSYDVILMDVRMPDLDGLEATRRIRASERAAERRPTILALTANVMQGEADRCRTAGMDGYLAKPLRLDALTAALAPFARPAAHGSAESPTVH